MAAPARSPGPELLRVAFVGKGGSGKSMIAGTFARLLAAEGQPVLALDSDPLPGLAFSAGMGTQELPLPDEAVEPALEGQPGPRYRLRSEPEQSVERYAATGPDGLRFLQLGKVGPENTKPGPSQQAFRLIAEGLTDAPWHLVGDLPGGTRQPFFGWARWARLVLVVAEPGSASLLSARRLARLGAVEGGPDVMAVASLVDGPEDVTRVQQRTGLPLAGVVPRDAAVAVAERRGLAPIDSDPASPAIDAVRSLLQTVRRQELAG